MIALGEACSFYPMSGSCKGFFAKAWPRNLEENGSRADVVVWWCCVVVVVGERVVP